jgi:hypothetical protein
MRREILDRREEGTASVIGTLLAISILLSIFSIIVTGFVPRWGEDREADHMKEVYSEFARLKASIDQQILDCKNTNGPSIVTYTPISLGMQTVPIFTASSTGNLAMNEALVRWDVSSENATDIMISNGYVQFASNNIYVEDIKYVLECGGVIAEQGGNAVVRIGPQFNAYIQSGELTVDYTLVSLLGDSDSMGGSDTHGIVTQCTTYVNDTYDYPASPEDVTITIKSRFTEAWSVYFSTTLQEMGLVKGAGGDFTTTITSPSTLELEFNDVDHLRLGYASVKVRLE